MAVAYVSDHLEIVLKIGSEVTVTMSAAEAKSTVESMQHAIDMHDRLAKEGSHV